MARKLNATVSNVLSDEEAARLRGLVMRIDWLDNDDAILAVYGSFRPGCKELARLQEALHRVTRLQPAFM